MERLIYAKDLYYEINKTRNNFKIEFIVAYGSTAYKISSNMRVFYDESLFPVWEENELGNYDLNLPEKAYNAYKKEEISLFELLPKFMKKEDFARCKINIGKLKNFEKELNKKIFNEGNELVIPSWAINAQITVKEDNNGKFKVVAAEM